MPPLKYFPRLNRYKASNVSFDPSNVLATSYDWWVFVRVINGAVVFNNHAYSTSTRRHQFRVRMTMAELGITPDLIVETRLSLGNINALDDAWQYAEKEAKYLQDKATRARSNKAMYLKRAAIQLDRVKAIKALMAKGGAA